MQHRWNPLLKEWQRVSYGFGYAHPDYPSTETADGVIDKLHADLDQQRFNNKHNLSIDQTIADKITFLESEVSTLNKALTLDNRYADGVQDGVAEVREDLGPKLIEATHKVDRLIELRDIEFKALCRCSSGSICDACKYRMAVVTYPKEIKL